MTCPKRLPEAFASVTAASYASSSSGRKLPWDADPWGKLPAFPLQQIHLGVLRCGLGKSDAKADQAHGFSSAGKCFGEEGAEIL